jgi:hypothetical protein
VIYLFLFLLYGIIVWLEVPEMVRKKQIGLLVTFSILMVTALIMSVAFAMGLEIPSLTMLIMKMLAPLSSRVFGVKI